MRVCGTRAQTRLFDLDLLNMQRGLHRRHRRQRRVDLDSVSPADDVFGGIADGVKSLLSRARTVARRSPRRPRAGHRLRRSARSGRGCTSRRAAAAQRTPGPAAGAGLRGRRCKDGAVDRLAVVREKLGLAARRARGRPRAPIRSRFAPRSRAGGRPAAVGAGRHDAEQRAGAGARGDAGRHGADDDGGAADLRGRHRPDEHVARVGRARGRSAQGS